MGKALYRKYRPKSLAEVSGQSHITTTLANAIKSGKISHAYLLTGPRGVGKTSIARILAHELNGLPYDVNKVHLDIIEIDAASNRRIDEIRNLRDKVHVLPTSSTYKVYIIDEVHMLTREAFNALLKTLEEPPAHVIFILATTEAHKLPETIVSRTQHFAFRPIEPGEIAKHLGTIAKAEKITIDKPALELIAQHGGGSFRDSISLLDQARGLGDSIGAADVERLLGVAPQQAIKQLAELLQTGTPKDIFESLAELRANGQQSGQLAHQLGDYLRDQLLQDSALQTPEITRLLHELLQVSASAHADRLLELCLLDYILGLRPPASKPNTAAQPSPAVTTHATPAASTEETPNPTKLVAIPEARSKIGTESGGKVQKLAAAKVNERPAPKSVTETPETGESKAIEPEPTTEAPAATTTGEPFTVDAWPVVLATIKKKYNTLYGILRMASPSVDGSVLTLSCTFSFHQKQINESKNRKIISDIIQQQTGQAVEITCVVVPKNSGASPGTTAAAVNTQSVSDIFGGAEVLES